MLKTMYVLTILMLQGATSPVVISQHSTLEACEKAFQTLKAQMGKNTNAPTYQSTPLRTYACTETEVYLRPD